MLKWLIFWGGTKSGSVCTNRYTYVLFLIHMPPAQTKPFCPATTRERGIWPPMDDEEAQFLLEDEHEKVGQPLSLPPPLFVYFRAFAVLVSIGTTAPVALPRALVYMHSARL